MPTLSKAYSNLLAKLDTTIITFDELDTTIITFDKLDTTIITFDKQTATRQWKTNAPTLVAEGLTSS